MYRSSKLFAANKVGSHAQVSLSSTFSQSISAGADPGFDQGGAPDVTGLKLPFWGLSFVEFWCWGLIFGGQGGAGRPGPPPGSAPEVIIQK